MWICTYVFIYIYMYLCMYLCVKLKTKKRNNDSWKRCLGAGFPKPVEGRRDRCAGWPPDWGQWVVVLAHCTGTRPGCFWWGNVSSYFFWRVWLLVVLTSFTWFVSLLSSRVFLQKCVWGLFPGTWKNSSDWVEEKEKIQNLIGDPRINPGHWHGTFYSLVVSMTGPV